MVINRSLPYRHHIAGDLAHFRGSSAGKHLQGRKNRHRADDNDNRDDYG